MKKIAIILVALLLLASFAACASGSARNEAVRPTESMAPSRNDYKDGLDYSEAPSVEGNDEKSSGISVDFTEKIVYTADYTVETKEFDKATDMIARLVKEFGGFIESSSVNGNTYYAYDRTYLRNRYANYTLRIPCERFEEFLSTTGDIGSVTRKSQNAANISSQYSDVYSRLNSYKVSEQRVLELLAKAEQMSDILALESKLSEIRYQIESLQRRLDNMDTSVNYSTVYLYLYEVETYTPIEKESFFTRIGNAFVDGWSDFVEGLGEFAVWFVGAFPVLLLLAAIVVVVVIIVKKIVKKHKKPVDKK